MYQFIIPTRIIFGQQAIYHLSKAAKEFGKKALVVTGKKAVRETGLLDKVQKILCDEDIEPVIFDKVVPEPDTEIVDKGIQLAKEKNCDLIIGLGGGSVIDVGKAIAGLCLVIDKDKTSDYLEVDGTKKLLSKGLDFISVPTVSGTGAEVTNNAVLVNPKTGNKRSLRSKYLFPKIAILDPELTSSVPYKISAISGIDCFTHLIEGYISKNANSITDMFGTEGIKLTTESLHKLIKNNCDNISRANIMLASLYGGIIIFNSGLGLVHGIASVIGPRYHISHGLACALVLSKVLEYNLVAVNENKKKQLESFFGSDINYGINNLIKQLRLDINPKKFGIQEKDISEITDKTLTTSSAKKNPRPVTKTGLINLLEEILR